MCVNNMHIILTNEGLHVSITVPSAPPSGHQPLLGKLLISSSGVSYSKVSVDS